MTERSCGAAARRVGPRLCRTPSTSPTRGLGHDTGNHPERAERITVIEASLQQRDWLGYERRQAAPATREAIVAVHAGEYVDTVRSMSERGGAFDADTLVGPGSYEAAASAAGAACGMAEALLAREGRVGFCAIRPPGHDARHDSTSGFCLFNSVAVAARHALDALGARRVFILDWDVHHGDGANDIFRATDEVLFASIHQSGLFRARPGRAGRRTGRRRAGGRLCARRAGGLSVGDDGGAGGGRASGLGGAGLPDVARGVLRVPPLRAVSVVTQPLVRDVLLCDGSTLRLRAPGPEDLDDLKAFYERLLPESRYLRFHGFGRTDAAAADYANADGVDRVAVIGRHGDRVVAAAGYRPRHADARRAAPADGARKDLVIAGSAVTPPRLAWRQPSSGSPPSLPRRAASSRRPPRVPRRCRAAAGA